MGGGDRFNLPLAVQNRNLLIIIPTQLVSNHPGPRSQPGKRSPMLVADVVNLDEPDPNGQFGKVYRGAWLGQSAFVKQLGGQLRQPFLVRVFVNMLAEGKPYYFESANDNPQDGPRGQQWLDANTNFQLSGEDPTLEIPFVEGAPQQMQSQNGFNGGYPQQQGYGQPQGYGQQGPPPGYGPPPVPDGWGQPRQQQPVYTQHQPPAQTPYEQWQAQQGQSVNHHGQPQSDQPPY
jgi:hypothetical protein